MPSGRNISGRRKPACRNVWRIIPSGWVLQPDAGAHHGRAHAIFGSCSSQGHICFSWRLMQYPPEAIDYIVVHEAGTPAPYMNHGAEFYALIAHLPAPVLRCAGIDFARSDMRYGQKNQGGMCMKQAIALAGGGTKGAYQVGAWKAMRELIPFDIVTGTSIGSVTAALMVQGDFDRAWELWTHITGGADEMLERADATPHEKRELAALAEHPER